jgi:DNA repair protein RadD
VLRARGVESDAVTGSTNKFERARLIQKYKSNLPQPMVLCNYGVLTTGFDAPSTSAAIIARPTQSLVLYSQMVGRAIRGPRAGGNAKAEIVTVVDQALPGFRDPAEAFTNWEDVWT